MLKMQPEEVRPRSVSRDTPIVPRIAALVQDRQGNPVEGGPESCGPDDGGRLKNPHVLKDRPSLHPPVQSASEELPEDIGGNTASVPAGRPDAPAGGLCFEGDLGARVAEAAAIVRALWCRSPVGLRMHTRSG